MNRQSPRTPGTAGGRLRTRDLAEEDLEQVRSVRARAFGGGKPPAHWYERERARIAAGRALGVEERGRVVAAASLHPMRQFWGGRLLPMAGIGGVAVAPEHRGRGVGTLLMRAVLDRAVELGDAVSALYPATVPVYRRLGWELAGAQHRVSFPADALRRLGDRAGDVRPADAGDAAAVLAHLRAVHERSAASGPLAHTEQQTRRTLEDPEVFGYRTDDGFLRYGWRGSELVVHELTAGSEASLRALWGVVGSGSSIARTVHAYLPPHDPVHLLLDQSAAVDVQQVHWMLRLLDLPAAVAGRGFPAAVSCDATLTVDDPLLPRNNGRWLLRVAAGRGEAVPAPPGVEGVRLGARGLAALYAGTSMATLRVAGLASGGRPADDAGLDAAFAGDPYLLDTF